MLKKRLFFVARTFSLLFFSIFCSQIAYASQAETQSVENQFIQRAVITSDVENREPVDNLNATALSRDLNKVFFFTEVSGLANQTITHRWSLEGQVQAEVSLNIGSNRWRTYSSKNLFAGLRGSWLVEVIDQQNRVLSSATFTY